MAHALDVSQAFKDISEKGDGSALLRVAVRGEEGPCPADLAVCHAHYRFLKETANGEKVKGSSKEVLEWVAQKWTPVPCVLFDIKVPEMGFRRQENEEQEPRRFVLGEGGAPQSVEVAVRRLTAGGTALLKLAAGALPAGRPSGELTVEVQLVRWREPLRGPGDVEWSGLRSVVDERVAAEAFLRSADEARGRLEALAKLQAERNMEDALSGPAAELRHSAGRALRRFRRAAKWLEQGRFEAEPAELDQERARVLAGTAKSLLLEQKQFSLGADGGQQAAPKGLQALQARSLALRACELDPQSVAARAVAAFAYLELGELAKAREFVNRALELDPHHVAAQSEHARINSLERHGALRDGDRTFRATKQRLDAALKQGGPPQVQALLLEIAELVDSGNVSWDTIVQSKLGKTIGEIHRDGPKADPHTAEAAAKLLGKLLQLTDRKCRQLI